MTQVIDIQRRFRNLTDNELEDIEDLAALGEIGNGFSIGWPELLNHRRVILLAEAGSGKTTEMGEQAKRLVGEGRFAVFIPLESLNNEHLVDLLSVADGQQFEKWKTDRKDPAWFFLDAVDELKLTGGTLDRALGRLSKTIDGHIDRARVFISCRPSDWRSSVDLRIVHNRLPVLEATTGTPPPPSDEVFFRALRRDFGTTNAAPQVDEEPVGLDAVRTVAMLPMNGAQIKLLAEHLGVNDADAFLAEVDRQNAWTFARRPLDLTELIATWTSSGCLGTRTQQHDANVTAKLKDQPDRPDSNVLTDVQARDGAERLALAHALTHTRTIRSPEQALNIDATDGVLEAEKILPNWTDAQRRALLRRGLFDPATYGRVQFHHRSVQEYLAALHLRKLREEGMSVEALFRLLFAEKFHLDIVVPSMRPIAAWLALWDDAVREELIEREPEALLSLGDPETLDLATKSYLIKAFVAAYGEGGRRGLNIPTDEVRRLSHPDLAPVIRECWGNGPENDDVRQLLLDMIWLGPVADCADLAEAVALDAAWPPNHRITAISALLACNRDIVVRKLADAMLTEPAAWPDDIVHGVAADLFPSIITVEELAMLMERTSEPQRTVGGFDWASRQIANALEPWSESAIAFRNKMVYLIRRGREETQEPYHTRSRFDHLASALALLCDRQLSIRSQNPPADLIHACVVASRFGDGATGTRGPLDQLRAHFKANSALRSEYIWSELALMNESTPSDAGGTHLYFVQEFGLTGLLTESDRTWLDAALADESRPEHRAVALHAVMDLWRQRERPASELHDIRRMLKGHPTLVRIMNERTAPPAQNEEIERMERHHRQEAAARAAREEQRLEKWRQWRNDTLADAEGAFSAEKRTATVSNLYSWLRASHQDQNRYNIWDKKALTEAFGTDVAQRADQTFRSLWRENKPPVLWSARPPADRNKTPHDWIYGLMGVSAESSTPGWTDSLSPDEARIAAVYATIELNGFAPFIADLAASHPEEVDAVIGGEVSVELGVGDHHDNLPALQDVTYGNEGLKRLLTQRLLAELRSSPHTFTDETGLRWAYHLGQVFRVLNESEDTAVRKAVAQECVDRCEADPVGTLSLAWLRGLFPFDPVRGTKILIDTLAGGNDAESRERATKAFASLFGGRDVVVFQIAEPAQRARVLGQLLRCAYSFISPRDDRYHAESIRLTCATMPKTPGTFCFHGYWTRLDPRP